MDFQPLSKAEYDVSYTKCLVVAYIAIRSLDVMLPRKTEKEERERRSKEREQYVERFSFFTFGPFPKVSIITLLCLMYLNLYGFLYAQKAMLSETLARFTSVDIASAHAVFNVLAPVPVPYAPSLFRWNDIADILAAILAIVGIEFRAWSMRTLGRFFTFQLGVSNGQHIVQTGPYRFVRHPSYTGIVLMAGSIAHLFLTPIYQDIVHPLVLSLLYQIINVSGVDSIIGHMAQSIYDLATSPKALLYASIASPLCSQVIVTGLLLTIRIPQEEKMLAKNFGQEWVEFSRTRSRILPYIC
jgi:protein-S-isoprenylcysteine O-methyltransferase Ste14